MANGDVRFLQGSSRIWTWIKSLVGSGMLPRSVVLLLIFVNLAITLPLAALLNIWIDEAFSLQTSSKDIGYAFGQALRFETQPPLYFVLLSVWRNINSSVYFARLFSVFCVALTIYTAAKVSERFFKEVHPGWIAAYVGLHPFVIWAAVEIRLYAFLILLCALLFFFFFEAYLCEGRQVRARWLYGLVSVLGLYTQYFFGFLLVAKAIVLLTLRRWQALANYLADMLAVGLCFTPMILVVPTQLDARTKTVQSAGSLLDGLKFTGLIGRRILWYGLPSEWIPSPEWRVSYFGFAIAVIFLVIKYRRLISLNAIAIWITTLVSSLLFVAVLYLTREAELYAYRHTAILFLPSILSVFSVVKASSKRKVMLTWTLTTLAFNVVSLYFMYKPMAKSGDWIALSSYLMASEKPNQPILVFPAHAALPLGYYYSGPNRLVPLPKQEDCQTYNVYDFVLKDEKEIFTALSCVPGNPQYLWLVTNDTCKILNVDLNCPILEEFVSKYHSVELSKTFFRSTIRLLRRKDEPISPALCGSYSRLIYDTLRNRLWKIRRKNLYLNSGAS